MKITILGSAAAEAIPNPFCQCSVCQTARRAGGRDCRLRSAAIINDDLLIDLGPDIISAANQWGIYLGNLETLLITHGHEDHWLPQNLLWRRQVFAPTLEQQLSIYAPEDVLLGIHPGLEEPAKLRTIGVFGGQQFTAGKYHITVIPATHGDGKLTAVLYVIDDGSKRVFYATDTAPLSEMAWTILRSLAPIDLVLLDATMGPADGGQAHHGIAQFLQTRKMMIESGIINLNSTILVAHHFSHNAGFTHEELTAVFSPYNVQVAYDGWIIDL